MPRFRTWSIVFGVAAALFLSTRVGFALVVVPTVLAAAGVVVAASFERSRPWARRCLPALGTFAVLAYAVRHVANDHMREEAHRIVAELAENPRPPAEGFVDRVHVLRAMPTCRVRWRVYASGLFTVSHTDALGLLGGFWLYFSPDGTWTYFPL